MSPEQYLRGREFYHSMQYGWGVVLGYPELSAKMQEVDKKRYQSVDLTGIKAWWAAAAPDDRPYNWFLYRKGEVIWVEEKPSVVEKEAVEEYLASRHIYFEKHTHWADEGVVESAEDDDDDDDEVDPQAWLRGRRFYSPVQYGWGVVFGDSDDRQRILFQHIDEDQYRRSSHNDVMRFWQDKFHSEVPFPISYFWYENGNMLWRERPEPSETKAVGTYMRKHNIYLFQSQGRWTRLGRDRRLSDSAGRIVACLLEEQVPELETVVRHWLSDGKSFQLIDAGGGYQYYAEPWTDECFSGPDKTCPPPEADDETKRAYAQSTGHQRVKHYLEAQGHEVIVDRIVDDERTGDHAYGVSFFILRPSSKRIQKKDGAQAQPKLDTHARGSSTGASSGGGF